LKFYGAFETQAGKMVSGNMNDILFLFSKRHLSVFLGAMKQKPPK
jgi:hypothetical protein